jgi:hypothetical protein
MTAQVWHVPPELWRDYASGRLDPAAEASLETHVTGCPVCRASARAHVAPATSAAIWNSVNATVTRPRLPASVRWLRRLGVPEHELVLLGSVDGLVVPWVTAVGAALAVALLSGLASAYYTHYDVLFVVLAPLVPVLAVVAAFDVTESLRELSAATPYSKLRLTLLRATAALVVAVPVMMALGLLIPDLEPLAFVWLLPALALTISALVLLTWMAPRVVGGVLGVAWTVLAGSVGSVGRIDVFTSSISQAVFACAAAVLAAVLVTRTSSRSLLGGDS